jgi:hypothetical protein
MVEQPLGRLLGTFEVRDATDDRKRKASLLALPQLAPHPVPRLLLGIECCHLSLEVIWLEIDRHLSDPRDTLDRHH